MKPETKTLQGRTHHSDRTLLFLSLIATACLAAWFAAAIMTGNSSSGWSTSIFHWIALRGAKEWLLAWLCLWGAVCLPQRKWYLTSTILCSALSLLILDHWAMYGSVTSFGWDSILTLWIPSIVHELCTVYWMYAGVLLGLSISNAMFVRNGENSIQSVLNPDFNLKRTAIRAIVKALIFTSLFSMIVILLGLATGNGRLPGFARVLFFFQLVIAPPLFRFICGLSVAGLVYLIRFNDRRIKTGVLIITAVSTIVVIYSCYLSMWATHFSLLGQLFPRALSANILWAVPFITAMSPVGGFAIGIPLLWLAGYRIVKLKSSTWSANNSLSMNGDVTDSEDANDPEMYL
ncbi:MAG: hypothetical protein ACK5YR_18715 [Pirellula sp.]